MRGYRLFLMLLWPGLVLAQNPISYDLDSIEIISQALRSSVNSDKKKNWQLDDPKHLSSKSVDEIISQATGTFIKSYGLGSLATSSIRGGNANQSLVLWNGLPIQSPMLGQLDLALLPVDLIEQVSFQPGGNTGSWGNGAVTGVISMSNQTDYEDDTKFLSKFQIGSFGQHAESFKIAIGTENWKSTTRIINRGATNDFLHRRAPKLPLTRMQHATSKQQGILQSFNRKLGRDKILDIHLWHQKADRDIPPLLSQVRSLASQEDKATRLMVSLVDQRSTSLNRYKLAYFKEDNNYQDDEIKLSTNNRFSTVMAEAVREINFSRKFKAVIGTTHSFVSASTDAYVSQVSEYRAAVFTITTFTVSELSLYASLRQGVIDHHILPLVPALEIRLPLARTINLGGKLSRDYRAPTLNDRFWMPGGDADLKPEKGWSQEVDIICSNNQPKLAYRYHVTFFNRNIDDWILWSRNAGSVFWSPQNITKVWSRGIEQELELGFNFSSHCKIKTGASFAYIKSTNQEDIPFPKLNKGDQLVYTPENQGSVWISFTSNKSSAVYRHHYTGSYRGINSDLNSYDIASLRISHLLNLRSFSTQIYLSLHNIWNQDYLAIEGRPMPKRNYEAGIQFKI